MNCLPLLIAHLTFIFCCFQKSLFRDFNFSNVFISVLWVSLLEDDSLTELGWSGKSYLSFLSRSPFSRALLLLVDSIAYNLALQPHDFYRLPPQSFLTTFHIQVLINCYHSRSEVVLRLLITFPSALPLPFLWCILPGMFSWYQLLSLLSSILHSTLQNTNTSNPTWKGTYFIKHSMAFLSSMLFFAHVSLFGRILSHWCCTSNQLLLSFYMTTKCLWAWQYVLTGETCVFLLYLLLLELFPFFSF